MQIGDKVVVIDYPAGRDRQRLVGRSGVVNAFKSRYVHVAVGGDTIPFRYFLPTELKQVVESSFQKAEQSVLRQVTGVGTIRVTTNEAQSTAVALGLKLGEVSLNDVYYSLSKVHGVSVDQIELESNSVFVGGAWNTTATEVRSNRKAARGRKITVWQYVPFVKAVAASVTNAYEVQVNYPPELVWYRSNNLRIRDKVFGSLEDAQKAAQEQEKFMGNGYKYRGAEVGTGTIR